jgi:hypothetical protein
MSKERKSNGRQVNLSEASILHHLSENPDFFERHVSALDTLKIPHPTHGAISLIEHQVSRLNSRNRILERRLEEMVATARENEGLGHRLHRLALELIEAEEVDDVLAATVDLLRSEFTGTEVTFRLLDHAPAGTQGGDDARQALSEKALRECACAERPMFGEAADALTLSLFGIDSGVNSTAIIPLSDGRPVGLLALGSHDAQRFRSGLGTLFLWQLGEMVSRAVRVRLDTGVARA